MTQQQLANAVGLTKGAISQMELGVSKNPSAENLLPLSRALNVDPEWLMTGKGKQTPSGGETCEPSAEYLHQKMPWPESPEQISVAFIDDVASKVSNVVDADVSEIRKIILEAIVEHYTKGKQT